MSKTQILEISTTWQEKLLEILKEAADLLRSCHTHNMAALNINPGEFVELYSLTIDCREGHIQCSQPVSPSGFGYGRTELGFFRDGRAGLWESGFPKKNCWARPGWPAGLRLFQPNLNVIFAD